MRILVLSTYELGHQPISAASAASALEAGGHEVRLVDLAVDDLSAVWADWAEVCLFSIPMHTATRLAVERARSLRTRRPGIPMAAFGLYAPAAARAGEGLFQMCVAGEYEEALRAWLEDGARPAQTRIELGRGAGSPPARHLVPGLDRYARLRHVDGERLVGYVSASRGCVHRCRHCPVPVVYDGRIRIAPTEEVLADIDRVVELGAGHISFADPDFLNGPAHSLRVVRDMHRRHPGLSFDCTVKVEHILRHQGLWPELAEQGLLFVVSAFETVNDDILRLLEKNHTAADAAAATRLLRRSGVEVRPSLLPFTPWTSMADIVDLIDFVIENDLVPNVDPVHYAIRLLVPPGSLLLSEPGTGRVFGEYDPETLSHPWVGADPELEPLQQELEELADQARDREVADAFASVHDAVSRAARRAGVPGPRPVPPGPFRPVPGLSEAWFCCAEPTRDQAARAAGGAVPCL